MMEEIWVLQVFTLHQIVNNSTITLHATFSGVTGFAYAVLFASVSGVPPALEWRPAGASQVATHSETGFVFLATPMKVGE